MIENLTPHEINVCDAWGDLIWKIPPSGKVVRCDLFAVPHDTLVIDHKGAAVKVDIVKTELGEPIGLPPMEIGRRYIVSRLVAEKARRPDLLVPEDLVRDSHNGVVGCRRFSVICD